MTASGGTQSKRRKEQVLDRRRLQASREVGSAPLQLAALGVPQDEAAVLAAAGQLLIGGVPRQRKDAIGVAREGSCWGQSWFLAWIN